MEETTSMTLTVTPDTEKRIQPWIESGRYSTADAVIRAALQLLEERHLDALRAKLQSGIDQLDRGEGIPFTPELVAQMRRDAEERLRRGESPNPDVCP